MRRTLLLAGSALALAMASTAASANDLFVEQVGNANFGGSVQDGVNNETYILQTGNANSAGANFDDGDSANNNEGLVFQNGNRNVGAWSFESGNHPLDNNTLGIVQDGRRNFVNLNLNTDGVGVTNSTIYVEQLGDDNIAGPASTGGSFPAGNGNSPSSSFVENDGVTDDALEGHDGIGSFSSFGTASVGKVRGDNNFIGISQNGNNNALAFGVNGDNNRIGGDGIDPTRDLDSFTLSGSFFDDGTVSESFTGVDGLARQEGSNNVGVVLISGFDNAAKFDQFGNGQTAEIYQDGTGNAAYAIQSN